MYISIRKYKLTSRDTKTRGELTRQINELSCLKLAKPLGSCRTTQSMMVAEPWLR